MKKVIGNDLVNYVGNYVRKDVKYYAVSYPNFRRSFLCSSKLNSNVRIFNRAIEFGYVNKLDIWVSQKLNEIQPTKRISICDSLLKRNETDPFLKRIITGDEKWVVYDNVVRKR